MWARKGMKIFLTDKFKIENQLKIFNKCLQKCGLFLSERRIKHLGRNDGPQSAFKNKNKALCEE